MFRAFAELEPTEEAWRQFANRFGLLGFGGYRWYVPEKGDADVETLLLWSSEIGRMRHVVDLLEELRSGRTEDLGQRFEWADEARSALCYRPPPGVALEPVYLEKPSITAPVAELPSPQLIGLGRPRDRHRGPVQQMPPMHHLLPGLGGQTGRHEVL